MWDQQAAARKELQERLASYKAEKKKLRAKRTRKAKTARRMVATLAALANRNPL